MSECDTEIITFKIKSSSQIFTELNETTRMLDVVKENIGSGSHNKCVVASISLSKKT